MKKDPDRVQALFRQHPKLAREAMRCAQRDLGQGSLGLDSTTGHYESLTVYLASDYLDRMLATGEATVTAGNVARGEGLLTPKEYVRQSRQSANQNPMTN